MALPVNRHSDAQDGHPHGPARGGELAGVSDSRLLWAVGLNQLLTVGQVIAGVVSGSVALLSDAAHNFNDANALLIAYIARRVSRRKASRRYTFGFHRAEMIGALINLTLLGVIGLYLIYEGVKRLVQPEEIVGWVMAATAVVAIVVDVATAVLLWAMSKGSLNVRAAFVHNLVDAFGSIAVLIGAIAVIRLDWTWVDPAITLMIAGYVLWQVFRMMPQVMRVLMEGVPEGLDVHQVARQIERIEGVLGVHHLHVWQLDERHRALEMHVVVADQDAQNLIKLKSDIKAALAEQFEIEHSTLEFEFGEADRHCDPARRIAEH